MKFVITSKMQRRENEAKRLMMCNVCFSFENAKAGEQTGERIMVKKNNYFTDGCAGQYKNKFNFINLSHHFEDFGVVAEGTFLPLHMARVPVMA